MKRILFLLPGVLLAASLFGQSPVTSLHIVSDPADHVGHGETYDYGADVPFEVRGSVLSVGDPENVGLIKEVRASVGGRAWDLSFSADGPILGVGFYERAVASDPSRAGHPRFSLDRNISVCNTVGSFAVLDIGVNDAVDPLELTSFAAVFDADCNATPNGVTGMLRWNHSPNSELTISKNILRAGDTVTATVTLVDPAPPGGASVEVASNAPELIPPPPARIIIPAGERAAQFALSVIGVPIVDQRVRLLAIVDGKASVAEARVLASPRQITRLEMESDPDDPILRGRKVTYAGSDGTWSLGAGYEGSYVPPGVTRMTLFFKAFSGNAVWSLRFDAGGALTPFPGFYPVAHPFALSIGGNGADIPGSARGCTFVDGFFKVFAVDVDYWSVPFKVNRFAVEFEQRCDHATGSLRGRLYYNYLPPARTRAAKP